MYVTRTKPKGFGDTRKEALADANDRPVLFVQPETPEQRSRATFIGAVAAIITSILGVIFLVDWSNL